MWGEVLWHVMSCHVMWWSCHLMRRDCLCCVMSRDATRCRVMCAHVMSCHLLCPAMGWNVMSFTAYCKVPLVVRSLVWFEVVLWRCGDPNYCSLCTTKYYSVLQSTTPVLLCKYYSSTSPYGKVLLHYYKATPVLLCTIPVLLCTTKYYSSTTLHYPSYKVLLQHFSSTKYYNVLLQSATPVLPCITKYYSSTSLYYKSLQSTTPVVPRTLYKVLVLCTAK